MTQHDGEPGVGGANVSDEEFVGMLFTAVILVALVLAFGNDILSWLR